jgi:hypothetical protein
MIEKACNWTLGMGDRGGAFDPLQLSKASQDGGYKVHAFASGGIVSGPMNAIIGEAGPEAVLPLTSFVQVTSSMLTLSETMQSLTETLAYSPGFNMASGYSPGGGWWNVR